MRNNVITEYYNSLSTTRQHQAIQDTKYTLRRSTVLDYGSKMVGDVSDENYYSITVFVVNVKTSAVGSNKQKETRRNLTRAISCLISTYS